MATGMNPFAPPSPADRLRALRRALWEEDRAWEALADRRAMTLWGWAEARAVVEIAADRRMEAERALWGCAAGHGLD